MCGSRSSCTAALTDICLDKAVVQFASLQTLQHLHTVLKSVNKNFVISVSIFLCNDRLDHAAADRIQPVDLRIRIAIGFSAQE